jgi:hypothetical protein
MKVKWAILLMLFILAIPITMYWWNSIRKQKVENKQQDYPTPVLGRYYH